MCVNFCHNSMQKKCKCPLKPVLKEYQVGRFVALYYLKLALMSLNNLIKGYFTVIYVDFLPRKKTPDTGK